MFLVMCYDVFNDADILPLLGYVVSFLCFQSWDGPACSGFGGEDLFLTTTVWCLFVRALDVGSYWCVRSERQGEKKTGETKITSSLE